MKQPARPVWIAAGYARSLDWTLRHRCVTVALTWR